MRTSPVLMAMDPPAAAAANSVSEVVRSLVGLIELVNRERRGTDTIGTPTEQVLVDTEVDGVRYLLVRMCPPECNRIQLSPREREIVRMVAKGHPNKVIADVLNISSWTVCTHLRRIFAKLGVGSRAAMVAQLLDLGVLASELRIPSASR
jgi:DNA-binding CsgD family transcriptional regulator